MDPQSPAPDVLESEVHGSLPMPATPGDDAEQPEGVAFQVAEGTDLPGVPTGDQRPTNADSAQEAEMRAEVPPGGMNASGG